MLNLHVDNYPSLNLNTSFKKNISNYSTSIDYLFNFRGKLLRNFLYFSFLNFTYWPFSSLFFTGKPVFRLKIDLYTLLLIDSYSYDNYLI